MKGTEKAKPQAIPRKKSRPKSKLDKNTITNQNLPSPVDGSFCNSGTGSLARYKMASAIKLTIAKPTESRKRTPTAPPFIHASSQLGIGEYTLASRYISAARPCTKPSHATFTVTNDATLDLKLFKFLRSLNCFKS